MSTQQQPIPKRHNRLYAVVSFVAFLFGVVILSAMRWNLQLLVSLGDRKLLLRTSGFGGRDVSVWRAPVPKKVI